MTLKKELITKAAFNREIEKMDADQSLTNEFINTCDCDPNNKRRRRLKYTYGIVQGIDSGLRNNIIQNTVPAIRMRKIALSMTIGHMTKNRIVDIDILDAENISLVEVGEKYTHDYHRTQLMVETIQNNEFIQNAIHELANDGKLFKSKNHDEILEIEEKLDELELQLTGASRGMKLIHNNDIRLLEEKLYSLKRDEFLNGDFSIEDICFKVVADWKKKSVRVIVYKGKSKVETEREQIGAKGYAIGFEGLLEWINSQLPANEEIGKAFRKDTRMYPEIAIRELVANALIHQDLNEKGFPMIEIFSDRIEISNPGTPLVTPDRFIDAYLSRNEKLADLMRRMGFCEEKGSGLDKVIFYNELFQLPPINVIVAENRTRVTMYSYKILNALDKKEKIRACYQHACLKYVSNEKMTNQSLRDRFKIEDQNSAIASRIIKDALEEGVIKKDEPESKSRKFPAYLPIWA